MNSSFIIAVLISRQLPVNCLSTSILLQIGEVRICFKVHLIILNNYDTTIMMMMTMIGANQLSLNIK